MTISKPFRYQQAAEPSGRLFRRLSDRSALRGNQFWKRRRRHGRRLKYPTPDQLQAACEAYFQWVEDHPLYESRVFVYRGIAKTIRARKHRPMTRAGLYRYLEIDRRTWRNYRDREGFLPVCERVEMVIYIQLFELAAAGLINPRFIAPYLARAATG